MATAERPTAEEYERRIFVVQGWIIEGISEFLIKKQAVSQWNVSFKTAKRYMKLAFDGIKPELERTVEEQRAGKIAELEQRKRTMDQRYRNTPEGIRTLNDIDKIIIRLNSLERPRVHVIQGDAEKPIEHKVQISIVSTGKKIATSEEEVNV